MTPEQIGVALIPLITSVYAIYRAGQTNDDRTKILIKQDRDASELLRAAEKKLSDQQFVHMAEDIKRINDSIADILRLIRDAMTSKEETDNIKFRLISLESSSEAHYSDAREIRDLISKMRESCARHHRKSSDTTAIRKGDTY
jgi:hypothetical protein